MKQVLIKQGQAVLENVPAPVPEAGTVLVQVQQSCISVGTEMSGISSTGTPLWKRAIKEPKKVAKAVHMATTQGVARTARIIKGELEAGAATGYSAAGIVIALGEGVDDLSVGQRVACAGAQCAHHAEIIRVPRNLTTAIPDNVQDGPASTVTLGAIAMQGVRRASPTMGEIFVVIGLGVLGQLTSQLLKANGCRVIGVDLDHDRINLALDTGMNIGLHPDDGNQVDQVARLTDGNGADGVIITAATKEHSVVSQAFGMCRKKGRVVLVGDVGLNLDRSDFYQKELDFFISTSYGPGRYDSNYEEHGLDYPLAYVRWTENRNMAEYMRLLSEERVNVKPLIGKVFPIDDVAEAYEELKTGESKPVIVLLEYPDNRGREKVQSRIPNPLARQVKEKRIRVAVIGAGGFAKGMHLPNLRELSDKFHVQAIASRTGHNAVAIAKQYEANYATSDFRDVLSDPEIDAVVITTRHNLHASMVLDALRAGKHVLVEKPLTLTRSELKKIEDFYAQNSEEAPIVLTGFNRRFSPFALKMKEVCEKRSNPMIMNYRMNAGYLPLDHWVHTAEGGGRNIGEACHIYDLFTYLTGSQVEKITAQCIRPGTGHYSNQDNFVTTISFADGSVGTLTYTALGSSDYPKESMEVYVDGKVLVMDDYRSLSVFGAKNPGVKTQYTEKGQREELRQFADAIQKGGSWPIPLWQQFQAMKIAFDVEDQISGS